MAISMPNLVLSSGELSKLLRSKVPIETMGSKVKMTVMFKTGSFFYFWVKNRLHPFLTLSTVTM